MNNYTPNAILNASFVALCAICIVIHLLNFDFEKLSFTES